MQYLDNVYFIKAQFPLSTSTSNNLIHLLGGAGHCNFCHLFWAQYCWACVIQQIFDITASSSNVSDFKLGLGSVLQLTAFEVMVFFAGISGTEQQMQNKTKHCHLLVIHHTD